MPYYRAPYKLHLRKFRHVNVWYVRFYDDRGKRVSISTGETRKGKAEAWAAREWTAGRLKRTQKTTFAHFARNFWVWGKCPYIAWRQTQRETRHISENTAATNRSHVNASLMPFFKDYSLQDITPNVIEAWAQWSLENVSTGTTGNRFRVLKTMLEFAVHEGLLTENPCKKVDIGGEYESYGIPTVEEVQLLFSPYRKREWWGHPAVFAGNMLAAATGARVAEVMNLRAEDVFDQYIIFRDTKNKEDRVVPVPRRVMAWVRYLLRGRGGYVFSTTKGYRPVTNKTLRNGLYRALDQIGISEEQRADRDIVFHSWRHFFNSYLINYYKISEKKVQKVIGHRSGQMTMRYHHFDKNAVSDVVGAQTRLLGP